MTAPTLTEFILARIAEDEYDANAFVSGLGEADHWDSAEVGGLVHSRRSGHLIARGDLHMIGQHIARHDPARILAECEAKRRIVERHSDCDDTSFGEPCADLRDLGAVYADHPDYDDEWRP